VVWLLYVCLTAVHLYANYRAVSAVTMDTFNQSRLHIVVSHWLMSRHVLTPTEANLHEPLFTGFLIYMCIVYMSLLSLVWSVVDITAAVTVNAVFKAHDTRSRNRGHKSTTVSGAGFQHRFFVPCASGIKISGARNKDVSIY